MAQQQGDVRRARDQAAGRVKGFDRETTVWLGDVAFRVSVKEASNAARMDILRFASIAVVRPAAGGRDALDSQRLEDLGAT